MFVCSVDRTSPQRSVYWSQLRFTKSEFTQFYDPDHLFASGSYSLSLGSTKCLPRLSESFLPGCLGLKNIYFFPQYKKSGDNGDFFFFFFWGQVGFLILYNVEGSAWWTDCAERKTTLLAKEKGSKRKNNQWI